MAEKVYLGDSVYAEFDTVIAGDVTLTTENGYGPTSTIYLEPQVLDSLNLILKRHAVDAYVQRELTRAGNISDRQWDETVARLRDEGLIQ